jgi:tetratricopeptide (TPR) repeat protein
VSSNRTDKVLLVGWDSAGWEQVSSIIDRGNLPFITGLIERGVMGSVQSIKPINPPMTYTSIVTGKYADKHGVLGLRETTPNGSVAPVTSASRRTKAFWEILNQNGRTSHIIGFPGTAPAEAITGTFIAPGLPVPFDYDGPVDLPEHLVRSDHRDTLADMIVSLNDIDSETLQMFIPHLEKMDPADRNLTFIGSVLAQTFSIHAATTWLMENTEWDVVSVNYPVIEAFNSRYLHYQAPKLPWVDPRTFEIFQAVTTSAFRMADMLLGRLLELAGDDASVIVYSPTSFPNHEQLAAGGPSAAKPKGEGLFVMRSPGCRQDELIHRVGDVDLTPTLLHLVGVPTAADMDGRVLTEAFVETPNVAPQVECWDTLDPIRSDPDAGRPVFDLADVGLMAPYAQWPARMVRLENSWNLVREYFRSSRRQIGMPWLIELCHTHPLLLEKTLMGGTKLYLAGHLGEAMDLMASLAKTIPNSPQGRFIAGLLALHSGDAYEALDMFEQACRESGDNLPLLYHYLGVVCLQTGKHPRAVEAYRKAVQIDGSFLEAHLGLSAALLATDAHEDAAEAALGALAVDFGNVGGHFALGKALLGMNQTDQARQAFQAALTIDASHGPLRRYLAGLTDASAYDLLEANPEPTEDEATAPTPEASAIRLAAQRVATWQSNYTDDLRAGIAKLPAYLTANAEAHGTTFSAEAMNELAATGGTDWVLRPALPIDQPTIGQMFDTPFIDSFHREILMMHPTGSGDIAGAASLLLLPHNLEVSMSLSTHQGAESSLPAVMGPLVQASIVRAVAGGASKISFVLSSDAPPILQTVFEAHGFSHAGHQDRYEMSAEKLRDRSLYIVDILRQREELPANIRLVRGDQIERKQFDNFLRPFFNDGSGPDPITPNLSLLVFEGDTPVAGYVGQKVSADRVKVPRLAVAASHRMGWATPMLMGEGCRLFCDDGIETIEFYTDEEQYPGFVKIARKLGAERLGSLMTMSLDLISLCDVAHS